MDELPLSPLQAASAIREVSGWSEKLKQRIEGLTWMFWGIVAPAIFVTYALAADLAGDASWLGLLWIPWAALGLLFTTLLWRSSRVTMTRPGVSTREFGVHAAFFLLAMVGSVVLVLVARLPLAPPTAVIVGIGLLVGMLGVREAVGDARSIGAWQTLGGIALIGFGIGEAIVHANDIASVALRDSALASAIASAIVLVSIGALRFARG